MNIIYKTLINVKVRLQKRLHDFVTTEDGDTNFISMLLIIGIVVVLAGGFLTLAKTTVLDGITKKVNDFLKNI